MNQIVKITKSITMKAFATESFIKHQTPMHKNGVKTPLKAFPFGSLLLSFFMIPATIDMASAQEQQPIDTIQLSLDNALNRGMEENADVRVAELDIQKSEERIEEVQGNFLPSINVNGNYTRNLQLPAFFLPEGSGGFPGGGGGGEGGNVLRIGSKNSFQLGAEAQLPLYNNQLIQNKKLAESSLDLSKQQLEANRNQIENKIKNVYFNALLARSSLDVTQQSLENAQSNYENVKRQNEQGVAPDYDLLRADVRVENTKPDVREARNNYESALNRLKLLTGIDIQQPVDLEGNLKAYYEAFPKEQLADYSLKENPQVEQLELQKDLQHNQISLEKSAYHPSLSAVGGYNYQAQHDHFDFNDYFWINTATAGLQLQIPIFSGLTRKNRIEQAQVEMQKIEVQKNNLERSLTVQVENALEQIQQVQQRVNAQERNIEQAKKGYKIAQKSYESGTINIVELNDAELALSQARMNYLTAIHDYLTALVDYEKIVDKNLITE